MISQQIDHTRDAMADTLEEIQRRLEPEHVSSYVKDVAYYVALELKGVARDLAGEAMTNVRAGTARSAEGSARTRIDGEHTSHRADEGLFREVLRTVDQERRQDKMSDQAQGIWQKLEANPIALGALGLAIGGLVGAIAPRLQQEDLIMGEAHDQRHGERPGYGLRDGAELSHRREGNRLGSAEGSHQLA